MISFSGIDCGGKSTQIEKVAQAFQEKKKKVKVIHSRGGYTPVLEFLKTLVRTDKGGSAEEQEQYREAVHASSQKRKLLLWLSIFDLAFYYGVYFRLVELFGTMVLADRYFWDSCIDFRMKYPEYDFEKWLVWKFAKAIYLKPKRSVIYTIPAELSMYRSSLKNEPWPEPVEVRQDRIERYMKEIELGKWEHVIDATGTIDQVYEETIRILGL